MPGDGFLNLLKPPGMTSHDVVAFVRGRLRLRRVGHLGTLDPAAAGVLPLSLGRASRLFRYAGGRDKAYRAEVTFGVSTETMDAAGRVTGVGDSGGLSEAALSALLASFVGEIEQRPPAFSAASVGGRRAHELARRGLLPETRPRRVHITELDLVNFSAGPRARALLDVVCSAGTYLRVLADDLGRAAGCGAYLSFLVRTRVGRFALAEALTLEECEAACQSGDIAGLILPPDWPLADLPAVALDAAAAGRFCRGGRVAVGREPSSLVRAYGSEREFLGLGEISAPGQLRPRVVLVTQGGAR
jgi:tRNA pseudouridine55 synthase